jgi:hypothetical protein
MPRVGRRAPVQRARPAGTGDAKRLKTAFANIARGIGMQITGSPADVRAFKKMLSDGAAGSAVFRKLIIEIGTDTDPSHRISADVGRSQYGVIMDEFGDGRVDLDDLDQLDDRRQGNRMTRYEDIVHFLSERRWAAMHGVVPGDRPGFLKAHGYATARENAYRAEKGQTRIVGLEMTERPDGGRRVAARFADRTQQAWDVDDAGTLTPAKTGAKR